MKVNFNFQNADDNKNYSVVGDVMNTSMIQRIDLVIAESDSDLTLKAEWNMEKMIPKIREWDGTRMGGVPNNSDFSAWRKLLSAIISEQGWFSDQPVSRTKARESHVHEAPEVVTEELAPTDVDFGQISHGVDFETPPEEFFDYGQHEECYEQNDEQNNQKRMISICFTGHRPQKLGGYYGLDNPVFYEVKDRIKSIVSKIIESNADCDFMFYTGGAIGVDQYAFWAIQEIRSQYGAHILNLVAVPLPNQASKWNETDKGYYHKMIKKSGGVVETWKIPRYKGKSAAQTLNLRNEYMVDNSDAVIAVWDGIESGGTYNCICYAHNLGKEIIYIDANEVLEVAKNRK